MTHEGAEWIARIRVGIREAEKLAGAERAALAVVAMSPATAARGLELCGLRDLSSLETLAGRRILLDVALTPGEFLILDGEKLGANTV